MGEGTLLQTEYVNLMSTWDNAWKQGCCAVDVCGGDGVIADFTVIAIEADGGVGVASMLISDAARPGACWGFRFPSLR
ncbi:MAG: hypothetical protein QOD67_1796 [Caballeronia sp.]|nr:hypothetical protein [Caballeronia sp.]